LDTWGQCYSKYYSKTLFTKAELQACRILTDGAQDTFYLSVETMCSRKQYKELARNIHLLLLIFFQGTPLFPLRMLSSVMAAFSTTTTTPTDI
jgi:hypothetical protein